MDSNENFLEAEYKKLLQYFIDNEIKGVFPFGTSGEFYAFDNGFYRHVLEVTCEYVRGKLDIYAGANHITPKGAIELAKIAEELKVDALSVLTPMFVSQTQKELEIYYRTVADATSLPIVIYNDKPKTIVIGNPSVSLCFRIFPHFTPCVRLSPHTAFHHTNLLSSNTSTDVIV